MAKGNEIVVTGEPRGRFLEGIIEGTPKPGTVMQIKAATEPVGGRHTWQVYDRAGDGYPSMIAILKEDHMQGKTATDAYVTGTRGFLYIPLPGDDLNMIIKDISGTADDYAIGDILEVDDGTGKLQDAAAGTGFYLRKPFVLMETITDPAADYLAWVMYTGA